MLANTCNIKLEIPSNGRAESGIDLLREVRTSGVVEIARSREVNNLKLRETAGIFDGLHRHYLGRLNVKILTSALGGSPLDGVRVVPLSVEIYVTTVYRGRRTNPHKFLRVYAPPYTYLAFADW